ncbi:hypothetical protein LTS10_004804 [Elasticomyces elasticus]|nr:hypothetical protein LTS10_004804 [Elasticomyces elasticus]
MPWTHAFHTTTTNGATIAGTDGGAPRPQTNQSELAGVIHRQDHQNQAQHFARPYDKDSAVRMDLSTDARYEKWAEQAQMIKSNNNRRLHSEVIEIEFTLDTHFSQKLLPGRRVDSDIKGIGEHQMMRGRLTSKMIKVVLRGGARLNASNYPAWREPFLGHQRDAQHYTSRRRIRGRSKRAPCLDARK